MAARFHHPPRPGRHRTGRPALRPVPDPLAPVLPMPRPAAGPSRLVVLACGPCDLTADAAPAAQAEQAAGQHDDTHHGGIPTAELHTIHTLRPALPADRVEPAPVFVLVEECAELLRRPLPAPDTAEAQRITATLRAALAAGRSVVLIGACPAVIPGDGGPDFGGAA